MRTSLHATLDSREKRQLSEFLVSTLEHTELVGRYPLNRYRVAVYLNDEVYGLTRGSWQKESPQLYLATEGDLPVIEKLSVLLTLTNCCESSEALTAASSKAITRYLLGEHNALNKSLIQAATESSGVAFSTDNRVASLIGEEWMLSNGEVVDVSGSEWTVCTAPAPVAGEFVVGQRVHYDGSSGGEAGDGVVTAAPDASRLEVRVDGIRYDYSVQVEHLTPLNTSTFTVGQRVHFTGEESGGNAGWGTVSAIGDEDGGDYTIRMDHGSTYSAVTSELTALPTLAFTVGQRVRYVGPEHIDNGETTVLHEMNAEGIIRISMGDDCVISATPEQLTAI